MNRQIVVMEGAKEGKEQVLLGRGGGMQYETKWKWSSVRIKERETELVEVRFSRLQTVGILGTVGSRVSKRAAEHGNCQMRCTTKALVW